MNVNPGDKVTTIDPRTGKKASGTVQWVSPTKKSYTVVLADGFVTYDFPVGVTVTEAAIDAATAAGWTCDACDTHNRDYETQCLGCGEAAATAGRACPLCETALPDDDEAVNAHYDDAHADTTIDPRADVEV